jgi:hypothetical protein
MFGCWKLLKAIDPVIDSNPIPLFDMKMLMGIVVTQGFSICRGKISLLTLSQFVKAVGSLSSVFHAKSLH